MSPYLVRAFKISLLCLLLITVNRRNLWSRVYQENSVQILVGLLVITKITVTWKPLFHGQ